MTSHILLQIITIYILADISGSETKKIRFVQLREYNITNIFLKKSYIKFGGETSLRPFHEKSN